MLLGVLLIVKYGRELKVCYPAGGMFIVLGIWWAAEYHVSGKIRLLTVG